MAQYKNIDIVPDETVNRIHLSQGDIGRTLIFYLFENALSWSVPASSTIKCQGTKPSGFGFSVSCTYSGNAVTCVTTDEMTDEYGQIEAELVITSSDESQVFGTSNIILDIEKNPHPASTEDGNVETAIALTAQVTALTEAIGDLSNLETENKTNLVSAINEANSHGGSGGGLTSDIKEALLECFEHVAWIDENGQTYYDALHDALYPPANLTSITCVYTQSGTVYTTDSLDSLKSDLVVTAHFDDSSTQTVSAYTLSGTLTVGTSTITVAYGGKTTTFTVTVTLFTTAPSIAEYDKVMYSDGVPVAQVGCCYTNPYSIDIDIEALKASAHYDSTNDYMTTAGDIVKVKYYTAETHSVSTTKAKNLITDSAGNPLSNNSVSKNTLSIFSDTRYITGFLTSGTTLKLWFTLYTQDVDNSYAYFDTTASGVMPVGVSAGDIIYAGANTPYYGMHNISEAES